MSVHNSISEAFCVDLRTSRWTRLMSESNIRLMAWWENHRGIILRRQTPTFLEFDQINLLLPGATGMQKATSMNQAAALPSAY
jgi:hypothetical protein